mmetsp:Transcript_127412/g.366405  ORF Transcript_127412/g.366405 Transcript_127412/m.366405 type:complete len:764 (-) Transcript_127412:106-2397(-)
MAPPGDVEVAYRPLVAGSRVQSIIVDEYWGTVGRITFKYADETESALQMVTDEFMANNTMRNSEHKFSESEVLVGIIGHHDNAEGASVFMLEQFLVRSLFDQDRESVKKKANKTGCFPSGRAVKVTWELPAGYEATGFRATEVEPGVVLPHGLGWRPIEGAARSWRSRLALQTVRLFNADHALLDQTPAWFFDIFGLTLAFFYLDVALDWNSMRHFWSQGHIGDFSAMALSVVCSTVFTCATVVATWAGLRRGEGRLMFGRCFHPWGSARGALLLAAVLLGHVFQLHMLGLALLSVSLGRTHPLLLDAKESEALLEATLTSLVQVYGIVYYPFDMDAKGALYTSSLMSCLSLGMTLAGYDRDTVGLEGLLGRFGLELKFAGVVAVRSLEVCARITGLALFQRLTRPFGGAALGLLDACVLAAMLKYFGKTPPGASAFLRNVFISMVSWRNPLLESATVISVPCSAYYAWRIAEVLLAMLWISCVVGVNEATAVLADDVPIVWAFACSSALFYISLPIARRFATFQCRQCVSIVPNPTLDAELSDGENGAAMSVRTTATSGPTPWTEFKAIEAVAQLEWAKYQAGHSGHVITKVEVRGNADGPHLIPGLCRLAGPSLKALNCAKCGVSAPSVRPILDCLPAAGIVELHFHWCPDIGDAGADAIANFLPRAASLRKLVLDWSGITDVGVKAMAGAIAADSKLSTLSLDWCDGISDEGARALIDCARRCASLSKVAFKYQRISNDLKRELDSILSANSKAATERQG